MLHDVWQQRDQLVFQRILIGLDSVESRANSAEPLFDILYRISGSRFLTPLEESVYVHTEFPYFRREGCLCACLGQ